MVLFATFAGPYAFTVHSQRSIAEDIEEFFVGGLSVVFVIFDASVAGDSGDCGGIFVAFGCACAFESYFEVFSAHVEVEGITVDDVVDGTDHQFAQGVGRVVFVFESGGFTGELVLSMRLDIALGEFTGARHAKEQQHGQQESCGPFHCRVLLLSKKGAVVRCVGATGRSRYSSKRAASQTGVLVRGGEVFRHRIFLACVGVYWNLFWLVLVWSRFWCVVGGFPRVLGISLRSGHSGLLLGLFRGKFCERESFHCPFV